MNYTFSLVRTEENSKEEKKFERNGSVWGNTPFLCQYGVVGDIERAVDEDTKGIFDWMKPFLDYMNKAGSKSINMDKSREFSYDCALNGSLFHYVLKILCDIPLPMNPTYYN